MGGLESDSAHHALSISGVSIDTRTIRAGNLFIPIIRLDNGHQYVQEAMDKGAVASLWQADQPNPPEGIPLIKVPNTLKALQNLSKAYRDQLDVKVIGVTGSNGKTTTKDMLHAIASTIYKTQKTIGNYNGEYGLPLTLLELEEDTEVAIVEMGMSHAGEIRLLSELARPDIAIITMIGVSHIANLGSKEAIAHAKLEIVAGLHQKGLLLINGDDPVLAKALSELDLPTSIRTLRFGGAAGNELYLLEQKVTDTTLHFRTNTQHEYVLPMLGNHNVLNALAAIASSSELHIPADKIAAGLLQVVVTEMRMQRIQTKFGYTIINDAWNASPSSMEAAIQTLISLSGYKHKILVLGDMLELGPDEIKYHIKISESIRYDEIDYVFTIGPLSEVITQELFNRFPPSHVQHYENKEPLIDCIQHVLMKDDIVLVKGSRGMKLEEIVQRLI
ncbi:UDP-N-acetylmuramoyl-tripeptide--D-alanyl-D-alanine ligase [Paenibacillus sp. 1_12]|uniref:UDP-N-acetylmuramoyl-tripeptide--D-alanyl-D- alanine ligase n=1 Tax=Paenibacillus sp. 1_12 TaxID=1566278 RepID=UPI00210C90D8|nr:UDP-N-acetylmuramoyl-tripeptide--D-alanyl-D-alanine ligase [Paenibacillus sp. 1_12]